MDIRSLRLVLGDQLGPDNPVLADADPQRDVVLLAEVVEEATYVRHNRHKIALIFSAMRHFARALEERGYRVLYRRYEDGVESLYAAAAAALADCGAPQLQVTEPGEYRLREGMAGWEAALRVPVLIREDTRFLAGHEDFRRWAAGRRQLRMEYFYREMRRRYRLLLDDAGEPEGGRWNFDPDNRRPFGRHGPGSLPRPPVFPPDRVTREAMADVQAHFPDNPGSLETFAWPVTREEARSALDDFVARRLPAFGPFQDAMWDGEPFLHHALLSAALNLKLLRAREVIDAALEAWQAGHAPLASVEGFVRQVLGWREFVRGVYWSRMPGYLEVNALEAEAELPAFYWSAETDMACLRQVIGQTLEHGYAHHIQRLMVTGLFALLLGVRPERVHRWYLAMYVDAVEWVEAPNTLGMSQYADGGLLASKPYAASGRYIQRMSNYCRGCRYAPDQATGARACPFTTLYWDFLIRHQDRFAGHPRAGLQWRNLERLDPGRRREITAAAAALRGEWAGAG